jgi:Enhancer of polycomb-like
VVRDKELPQPSFRRVSDYTPQRVQGYRADGYYRYIEKTQDELDEEVEYDMDEEVRVQLFIC